MKRVVRIAEKGMTDNEIIKELEFVARYCKDEYNEIMVDQLLLNTLDLINRQEVKIVGCSDVSVRESVLDEAKKIICGDRDKQYGSPDHSKAGRRSIGCGCRMDDGMLQGGEGGDGSVGTVGTPIKMERD